MTMHHVRPGTYKDEYGDGFDGFHIKKGGPPKPVGAVWAIFRLRHNHANKLKRLMVDFNKAV